MPRNIVPRFEILFSYRYNVGPRQKCPQNDSEWNPLLTKIREHQDDFIEPV